MRERPVHHPLRILLALSFLAGLALDAAAYERPSNDQLPTYADVVLIGGVAKTVVVQLLNFTPYTIDQDLSSVTASGCLNQAGYTACLDRKYHKSFMFAPVGWPRGVPGLPGEWVTDSNNNKTFVAGKLNHSTHSYSFVVAWDDQGGYVTNSSMGWTIKGVYSVNTSSVRDVPLRLWFSRVKPPNPLLSSEAFQVVSDTIGAFTSLIGVATEPLNPIAWLDAFTATRELIRGGFEAANSAETGGAKMYLAAYAVPDCTTCWPATTDLTSTDSSGKSVATDAVAVQWAWPTQGDYATNLVVTTHLLRGKDVTGNSFEGTVPIVSITVWTLEEYAYAHSTSMFGRLSLPPGDPDRQHLNTILGARNLSAYTQFALLYQSLNPSQQRTYQEALEQLHQHSPLTQQQMQLLEKMAAALEKGQTSLNPRNP